MKLLPDNARNIMVKRYALRNEKNQPVETPKDILSRTARIIAQAENNFRDGITPGQVELKFLELLEDFRFMPNGRTLANAGTGSGQLANCFVLPLEDDLGKTENGIFSILRKAVLVLQSGGGVGFSFGRIRPKGDSAGRGKATGAVSFIKVFDTAFWVIGQGGGRRSACMAVLPVWHPDIEDFIRCKETEGVIEHFNISVAITDEFMRAVEQDKPFNLINPRNKEVWKTVRARDLFDQIVEHAHHNGEPGVLFIDAANRDNPVPHQYYLEATNPCVTGDTPIATPSGWLRADSLNEGDAIQTVLGSGIIKTKEVHYNIPVYRVTFSDGGTIRATAAHQFHVRSSRSKFFEPVKLGHLVTGDWVRVFKSDLPNNKVPSSTVTLDDIDFGFLIGILLGDGCYTSKKLAANNVRISSHDNEIQWNKIIKTAFTKIGANNFSEYTNKNSHSLMIDPKPGKTVADWVRSTLLTPNRSIDKTIPEPYLNSNRDFLIGLLDGLFSTDGSIDLSSNHPLARFHTGSIKLAEQVRLALFMFGIHGRICKSIRKAHDIDGRQIRHDRPKYDVVISGESLGRFYEQIKLSHPEKQMKLNQAALTCNFTGGNWAAQVVDITPDGYDSVYDFFEETSDTWITAGYVSRGCGEQWLGPYENCCMASINLAEHSEPPAKDHLFAKSVDWDKLKETVVWTVRWLDNVVEANNYVPAIPELKEAAQNNRRIGISIMGLADLYYKLGIRYGSPEGVELAAQLMEFIRYESMLASIQLAKERGPFPGIAGSIYDYSKDTTDFWGKTIPAKRNWEPPQSPRYKFNFGRPKIDWKQLIVALKKTGIRNSCQTTIQPTGAIATIAGLEGYGCEPVFALSYIMKTHEGAEAKNNDWTELSYESKTFSDALKRAGLSKKIRTELFEQVRLKGTCQDIPDVPDAIKQVFVVSGDISVQEHVAMQAALQKFTDNAISKTINFPADATLKDVSQAYLNGWKQGLKGMTVYVAGSRQQVVLETTQTREQKTKAIEPFASESGIAGQPLRKVLPEDAACPDCGGSMVLSEGCMHCPNCGYAKCGM